MSDFFSSGSDKIDIVNADVVDSAQKKRHLDTRFDKKVISVTSADKVGEYKIKQWPTIGDAEEIGDTKNALGLSIDMLDRRRKAVQKQKQRLNFEYELEQISLACDAIEEEFQKDAQDNTLNGVSLEELDKIRSDAYEEGKKQGYDEGYQEGLNKGIEDGQAQGFQTGIEEGSKKGYEEGLLQGQEDGFVKGHNEGLESGQKIVVEQAERFRFLADCLANPLREIDRDVTDELAYMVSRLVKVITHKEISQNSDYLVKSIEKAITILPNAKSGAEIHLNPEDHAVISASIGPDYIRSQNWQLIADESLSVGDIKVTNTKSEVNWRINDRIDAVLEEFLTAVYPCVDSALRESVPGCPEYDEIPKKPLAPRNLSDLAAAAMSENVGSDEPDEAMSQDPEAVQIQDGGAVPEEEIPEVEAQAVQG